MKYAFFGTPEFAAIILEKLIKSGFPPSLVICNPDRPVGRKKIITAPPAKVIAQKNKIKVYQPEKLEIRNFKLEIGEADFAIVAAYAKIIPKEILEIPRLGTIGVHPSLLPKYRGATPIQTAILDGAEQTGVTLYLLDEKIDHGPILARQELNQELGSVNYEELHNALANLGANLLIKLLQKLNPKEVGLPNIELNPKEVGLPNIELNPKEVGLPNIVFGQVGFKPQAQNESEATYTKKFTTEDALIPPEKLEAALGGNYEMALEIDRKVRALNPEPGTWTIVTSQIASTIRANKGYVRKPFDSAQGKRMKILEAEFTDGKLKLKKIQFEGKKPQRLPRFFC